MTTVINVLYFASLRDQLDCSSERFDASPVPPTVKDLRLALAARGGVWQVLTDQRHKLLVAVNQQMADDATNLQPGDEVAFFPPVTGG